MRGAEPDSAPRIAWRILRCVLGVVLVVGATSAALASTCDVELGAAIHRYVQDIGEGPELTSWLAAATTLAEPAFPPVGRWDADGELPATGDPWTRFLVDRGLLRGAGERPYTPLYDAASVLDRLLASFGGAYADVRQEGAREPSDDLRGAVEATLERIRELARPAAVLVWDENQEIALRGLVWNWSSYPRLVLFQPPSAASSPITRAEAIASMENCVREIDHWFSVDDATARRLLSERFTSRLVVVGTEPDLPDLTPWWVPEGQELDVLAYEHPTIRHLEAFSVVFTGAPMPFTAWLRLLPRVRTNASPFDLRRYLQTPPSVGGP